MRHGRKKWTGLDFQAVGVGLIIIALPFIVAFLLRQRGTSKVRASINALAILLCLGLLSYQRQGYRYQFFKASGYSYDIYTPAGLNLMSDAAEQLDKMSDQTVRLPLAMNGWRTGGFATSFSVLICKTQWSI